MAVKSFYIYAYEDLDGVIRYIGRGSGRRINSHLTRSSNVRLHNNIQKAKREGKIFHHRKLLDGLSYEDACAAEIFWISCLGRIGIHIDGILWNNTAGGESGNDPTLETRRRQSQSHIGKLSPNKGIIFSYKWRQKLSSAHNGKVHSEETKLKMSLSHKRRLMSNPRSKESLEKIRLFHLGRKRSLQECENIRQGKLGTKYSQEHRDNICKATTLALSSPIIREKLRLATTAQWARRKSSGHSSL